jgi:predicted O-methyltransferase YrrM
MMTSLWSKILKPVGLDLRHLKKNVIELNDINELRRVFGWKLQAVLDDPSIYEYRYVEDANQRRLRDAECLATVVRNVRPSVCVDIGTSTGHSAACMAVNAPDAEIVTVNIAPEEIRDGKGGSLTTVALEPCQVGSYYRERKLTNITQLIVNTKDWEPTTGVVDVAFIDGCHDSKFVYDDTLKVLKYMKAGSFLLWHDFNVDLVEKYHWIYSVCLGVERLFANGLLRDRIFHLRDSWVGVYRVPSK